MLPHFESRVKVNSRILYRSPQVSGIISAANDLYSMMTWTLSNQELMPAVLLDEMEQCDLNLALFPEIVHNMPVNPDNCNGWI